MFEVIKLQKKVLKLNFKCIFLIIFFINKIKFVYFFSIFFINFGAVL